MRLRVLPCHLQVGLICFDVVTVGALLKLQQMRALSLELLPAPKRLNPSVPRCLPPSSEVVVRMGAVAAREETRSSLSANSQTGSAAQESPRPLATPQH
eukprot:6184109-Pleurochrysis_carterae.AAC.1